jgi:predicted glycoside hydrolase/deacetylase ChbG (UPF0249 family)
MSRDATDFRVTRCRQGFGRQFALSRLPMSSVQPSVFEAPRLVPILHADDCGLSAGITDAIMRCYDHGWLRRTSVVANGAGWEHAVAALRRRPGLSIALHLNLFEGRPLSAPTDVDLLVDSRGRFDRSFVALWAHGLVGAHATRLRAQVRLELRRQIERFLELFADRGPLSVDGHVHYHVIPLVFDELLRLSAEYPIDAIRLPREPLYWPFTRGAPRPPLVNVAKNLVLRALCRRAGPALRAQSVKTTEAFVGVLGTGAMTLACVRAALDHLRRAGTSGSIEILFHPGRGRPDEASLWADRPELRAFYLSANRDREAELLCSAALGQLVRAYGGLTDDGAASARPREVST